MRLTRRGALGSAAAYGALPIRLARSDLVCPEKDWQRESPQELGFNPEALRTLERRVGGAGCVVRHGCVAHSWGGDGSRKEWASAAKPVLGTLLMVAAERRYVRGPEVRVDTYGWLLKEKDRAMTLGHLANMTSGYGCREQPGTAWGYNDLGIQLYAMTLERVLGCSLQTAVEQGLGGLGFQDGALFESRSGRGVRTSPRDFARVGWLWLNEGRWRGRQVLPRHLFRQCRTVHVGADTPRTAAGGSDYLGIGTYGGGVNQTPYGPGVYGFNWWFNEVVPGSGSRVWPSLPSDAYQANGLWNRDTVTIVPSLGIVAAIAGARVGAFEPGKVDGEANRNLGLLVEGLR